VKKTGVLYNIRKNCLKLIPDKPYLKIKYKYKMGKKLNLKNPQTFNEKLQWLKLYDRNPLYTKLVDKYEVKQYIAEVLGEEYIIPTLGIYDSFEEIDFSKLPQKFVLKCTHDSGGLIICKDKNSLNMEDAKKKLNKSLKNNFYYYHREWPYKNVKPRIIAEEYMEDENSKDLIDYKFYCFNGEPKIVSVGQGAKGNHIKRISFLNMNFERASFKRSDYEGFEIIPPKPLNYDKMIEISRILSKNHDFLRVDLYEINDRIYFGELTFSPCSGYLPFEPKEYDKILGDWIKLSK